MTTSSPAIEDLLTVVPTPAVAICTGDAVSGTPTVRPPSRCYMSSVVNANINSTLLRRDCNATECFTWLVQNQEERTARRNLNCFMYDMVTTTAFPHSDLITFCAEKSTATIPTTTWMPSTALASDSSTVVGGAIGGGVVALALVVGFGWWCRHRRRAVREPNRPSVGTFHALGTPPVQRLNAKNSSSDNITANDSSTSGAIEVNYTYDGIVTQGLARDLEQLELHRIPFADVCLVQPLAEGAFGQVWLGNYMGQRVAVKKLLPRKATTADLMQFVNEIKLVAKFDCPYVVSFVGAAWHKPIDMVLVTEFMDRGDLRGVLQANAAKPCAELTWHDKVECALGIAEGLVYLHSMDPVVIHRDLKSRNVLLDSVRGTKITDFGIARETHDQTLTLNAGTYRWMAPEVVQDGHYSQSADVFSFGVILSELDTEQLPYANQRNDRGNPFTDLGLMEAVAKGRILPSFTSSCPDWFRELGLACLSLDPTLRPSATQVSYAIRTQLQIQVAASSDKDQAYVS
ncbi:TKL protein kinase [Aphanomyces invadans]|uniref:TKL protein kinase n=1 Tax=Aphanomyces invadans TaxID=157072 RepID=A0A024U0I5_9STRA|nr:TKL protein kinase [Aphanomyces invadans]ETV99749.1 TKL protein kinase [Aphanomyces invadans]|eukprot:XP_008871525.1 TKL protein kinase [Aphanomyces invadans]